MKGLSLVVHNTVKARIWRNLCNPNRNCNCPVLVLQIVACCMVIIQVAGRAGLSGLLSMHSLKADSVMDLMRNLHIFECQVVHLETHKARHFMHIHTGFPAVWTCHKSARHLLHHENEK